MLLQPAREELKLGQKDFHQIAYNDGKGGVFADNTDTLSAANREASQTCIRKLCVQALARPSCEQARALEAPMPDGG